MLLQRCAERARRQREERLALHGEAWLEALNLFLEACHSSLRPQHVPADALGLLHRMDWWLEHLRRSERALKRNLRKQAPDLYSRVRRATDQAFHLRNLTTSFFIRWQAFQDADRAYLGRREMEETLLEAARTSRLLGEKLDTLGSSLRSAVAGQPQSQVP